MANAWMNSPAGFHLDAAGKLAQVDPLAAALNPSTATEDPHMLVSAYVVTGFVVAAVYAAGVLRRGKDRFLPRGPSPALGVGGGGGVAGRHHGGFHAPGHL